MSERNRPYVGVSGLGSPEQHAAIARQSSATGLDRVRRPMVGLKTVHKTQWLDIPNSHGQGWYPVGDNISQALSRSVDTMVTAQMYLDPKAINDDPSYPQAFVDKVRGRLGDRLDAVQFDLLPYHEEPEAFSSLMASLKGLDVIVQCHKLAMAEGPKKALDKLKKLSPELGYVLFDASHGTGKTMDIEALKPFLDAAYKDKDFAQAGTNFGVAGGLNSKNVELYIGKLLPRFDEISWDAEGQLHNDTERGSLNMLKVRQYLTSSARVLSKAYPHTVSNPSSQFSIKS